MLETIILDAYLWDDVKALAKEKGFLIWGIDLKNGRFSFTGGAPTYLIKQFMEEVKSKYMKSLRKVEIYPAFRDLLPPLTEDERYKLEADIVANGVRDPIVLYGKFILDGHNRYKICERHNIPFETTEMNFPSIADAKMWIIHNQMGKRNLTTVQRAALGVQFEKLIQERDDAGLNQTQDAKERPRKAAAKAAGVADETLAKFKRIEKSGDEELKEDVKSGKKSINKATQELQERAWADGKALCFNRTNENIEWAKWSWNPFTGCLGPKGDGVLCEYCYAADMATRFKDVFHGFKPYFHADRLAAPFNTKIPETQKHLPGIHNVFLCSMGDLAHAKKQYLNMILDTLRRCEKETKRKKPKFPAWQFIILSKVPEFVESEDWPSNVWVGLTVDTQERVKRSVEAMSRIRARVKFFSVEPLTDSVDFLLKAADVGDAKAMQTSSGLRINGLQFVDWVIVGGRSKGGGLPAMQPKWKHVEAVYFQARAAGCKVYFKPNLKVVPKEYPEPEMCCSEIERALEIAKAKNGHVDC